MPAKGIDRWSMRTWITIPGIIGLCGSMALACGSAEGQVGAPCTVDDDCAESLICDEHDGQSSCQEAHGHGGDESDTGHEHDTGHDHDTGDEHDTGHDTEHHDSGSESGHDTEHSETDGPGGTTTTGDETTGGVSEECQAFCTCMTANCSEFGAYPFADEMACITFCGELGENERSCFAGFCADAEVEPSMGLQEHWCEHAWGELGNEKC